MSKQFSNQYRLAAFTVGVIDGVNATYFVFKALYLLVLQLNIAHILALFSVACWYTIAILLIIGVWKRKQIFVLTWLIYSTSGLACEIVILLDGIIDEILPELPPIRNPILMIISFGIEFVMVFIVFWFYRDNWINAIGNSESACN